MDGIVQNVANGTHFPKAELLLYQSRGQKSKAKLWESLKGQVEQILRETFASHQKDEDFYILWI